MIIVVVVYIIGAWHVVVGCGSLFTVLPKRSASSVLSYGIRLPDNNSLLSLERVRGHFLVVSSAPGYRTVLLFPL